MFVLKRTIKVYARSETVIQLLKTKSRRGFGVFTNHSFKFMMIGKVGSNQIRESCYISGTTQNITKGCIVHYSIYPGIVFWIHSMFYFLFLVLNLISVLRLNESISEFFFNLLIINTIFLFVETLEARHHKKWCNEKIERILYRYLAETNEIT